MSVRRLAAKQPEGFAFTPGNLEWARAQIKKYPEGRQASAIIPLLWRAQEQEGWLTRPAIELVADMLGMARFAMEFCAIESCGKCTPCRIGAVRGVETLDRIARGDDAAKPLLTDLCNTMKSGSLCALGGFTPYPVMSALTHFPDDFNTMKEAAE